MKLFNNKELELKLGNEIKMLRLLKNISRDVLCEKADISKNALIHLETGKGATIKTLIAVLNQLNKIDWLLSIAPVISINPLKLNKKRATRTNLKVKHDLSHKIQMLKKYNLTIEEYIKMFNDQKELCGNTGCNKKLDLKSASTHVDHNHITGKIRSLLCSNCNTALGFIKENATIAKGLIKYISDHNR